ncbi:MAG: fibrobacter succinogenes major paralogous domain-containing protein, partial [Bacteroidota bacterium]
MKFTNLVMVWALSAGTITAQAQNSAKMKQAAQAQNSAKPPKAALTEPSMPTVNIGAQEWMTRNLDVVTFRNGDTIPQAAGDSAWMAAAENETPAWCYYNNDSANGAVYGKLYNWFALKDTRGLAPKGWHLPSDKEWTEMVFELDSVAKQQYIGGAESVNAGPMLKTADGWKEDAVEANNSSGFTALPG